MALYRLVDDFNHERIANNRELNMIASYLNQQKQTNPLDIEQITQTLLNLKPDEIDEIYQHHQIKSTHDALKFLEQAHVHVLPV